MSSNQAFMRVWPLLVMFVGATGCGQQLNVQVATVKRQAKFDLQCDQLEVQQLGDASFGVIGCGRRASYITEGNCGNQGVDYCQAIANVKPTSPPPEPGSTPSSP
jgi:hypothetical protein